MLFSANEIRSAVTRVGKEIAHETSDREPLVLAGILRGCVPFLADLARAVERPAVVDFLALSPFGHGRARIESDLQTDVSDRDVIVVEDIVDTGLSLSFLLKSLAARGPRSLRVATLLDRPRRRVLDIACDWVGFEIDERFVIGYGMDFEYRYRNLPAIWVVDDLGALTSDADALTRVVYSP